MGLKWKEIKSDWSGVLTLFVGGAIILIFACLTLSDHHFSLYRGGPDLSREAHPVLYWGSKIAAFAVGGACIAQGVSLMRELIRKQREWEQNLEQEAIDALRHGREMSPKAAPSEMDESD